MPEPSFEWDQGKDWLNRAKHGVLFMAAQAAFFDPRRVIAEAPGAQRRGTPLLLLRRVGNGVLTVRFTYRAGRIRIFGAGFWRKGKRIYEQQNR